MEYGNGHWPEQYGTQGRGPGTGRGEGRSAGRGRGGARLDRPVAERTERLERRPGGAGRLAGRGVVMGWRHDDDTAGRAAARGGGWA